MAMADSRNWSTKTLAKQLARYVSESAIGKDWTVEQLFAALKDSIVEEAGIDLDPWGGAPG